MNENNKQQVLDFLQTLQQQICNTLEQEEENTEFFADHWQSKLGYGCSRVLKNGSVFEQAGVNFSHVSGQAMPTAATGKRPNLAGVAFEAMGLSLVIHPRNPYVPTTHANIRFFIAYPQHSEPVWWFGGGFDLTPFYPIDEDIIHWHKVANTLCQPFGEGVYTEFKNWCDEYFTLPHRGEQRGIGGLFFDDLNRWDFATCFAFVQAVGKGFIQAYQPIVSRRKQYVYGERERQFQLYRRGRYVEFNLIWDRGTHFGLHSGGRTESILMSMPPLVRFEYQYQPEVDSAEKQLEKYLQIRNWLAE